MMRRLSRSSSGSAASSSARVARARGDVDALEQLDEPLQRVVALAAPVVDQVERDLALLVGDLRHRQDLAGVHDRAGQPGLHALVQEDRVEHLPGGRVEPERDVGDAQGEVDPRVAARRSPGSPRSSRCRRGGSPPARWRSGRSARRPGCRRGRRPQRPVRSSMSRAATRTFHSAVRAWPSSSMVSATTAAPCSRDDRHHPGVPGVGAVAVLEVDRVDHAAAAEHLQAGLDHVRLGGVQHDRQRGRGGEPAGQLPHVLRAVAADVVDAQVEQVRAVAGLAAGDLHAGAASRRRASPRGTPSSRWRWSAPPPSARWRPGRTARGGRPRRRPASCCGLAGRGR